MEEGDEELLFNAHKISIWKDENILEIYEGDGCTTMCRYKSHCSMNSQKAKMTHLELLQKGGKGLRGYQQTCLYISETMAELTAA